MTGKLDIDEFRTKLTGRLGIYIIDGASTKQGGYALMGPTVATLYGGEVGGWRRWVMRDDEGAARYRPCQPPAKSSHPRGSFYVS